MKYFFKQFSGFLFLSWAWMSCAPLYVPSAHNVPMFSGKGEFQGSVNIGTGLNLQTAYALTDHVGAGANYFYASHNEEDNGRAHQTGEIALGYYTNFNEVWCFEVFAGYGFGKGNAFDSAYYFFPFFSNDRYDATGTYNKIYIQPSIGLRKDNFTWSLGAKINYIDFTKVRITRNDEQLAEKQLSKVFCSVVGDGTMPLLKDRIFIRYQVGVNFPVGGDPQYDYETIIASFGLLVKLIPMKSK